MNDGEICHEIHHNAVGLLAKGSCRGPPEVTGTKSDCEAPLLESAAAAAAAAIVAAKPPVAGQRASAADAAAQLSPLTPPPSWPWTPTC